jgi:hypothetical protein
VREGTWSPMEPGEGKRPLAAFLGDPNRVKKRSIVAIHRRKPKRFACFRPVPPTFWTRELSGEGLVALTGCAPSRAIRIASSLAAYQATASTISGGAAN